MRCQGDERQRERWRAMLLTDTPERRAIHQQPRDRGFYPSPTHTHTHTDTHTHTHTHTQGRRIRHLHFAFSADIPGMLWGRAATAGFQHSQEWRQLPGGLTTLAPGPQTSGKSPDF